MRGSVAALLLLFVSLPVGAQTTIRFEKGPTSYEITLLDLALSHTVAQDGPYRLQPSGLDVPQERALVLLNQGVFDVTYLVLNQDRERKILPVRIDLTRGIQGLRLLLVRRQDLPAYAKVQTLADLSRRFTAGFGAQWADAAILTGNGLKVTTSPFPDRLYSMLQAGRFGYFPRGLNEIWNNLADRKEEMPDVVVEPRLALYYSLVQCFAVAKSNSVLAERIHRGLEAALSDGSMKALFFRFNGPALAKAQLQNRVILKLVNDDLPLNGPRVDTSWWQGP